MGLGEENFYAGWRADYCAPVLREAGGGPPEKLVQAIWQHQRIRRGELKTADGRRLRVLHPGFISAEGGPDFRGAVLQFEDEKPVSGDVEVDLQTSGWHAHGHDTNANFKNVILHVVWDKPQNAKLKSERPVVLLLKDYLDSPLSELAPALENESGLPDNLRGKCAAPLRELSEAQLSEILHGAAWVRFENKANAMLARAKITGWEQTLWENLFRALGYKHNVWEMQALAESKSRWSVRSGDNDSRLFEIQTRLLGVAGLLPNELTRSQKASDTFLRRTWDVWWRERDAFADCTLPKTIWKFHGLRPANHPQRRLALASHWLASENLVSKIEDWVTKEIPGGRAVRRRADGPVSPANPKLSESLHEVFATGRDEFWSWHWTFNSARMTKPQPLLGEGRVTDLAVNVVLPWLWIRAKEGGNEKILREVERRFFAWPAAEDNSTLKLARQRLLGMANLRSGQILSGAARQQGLMQIVRDFCEHSNAICADCRFPELVQGLKSKTQSQTNAGFGF
jgi:hypothetical protein